MGVLCRFSIIFACLTVWAVLTQAFPAAAEPAYSGSRRADPMMQTRYSKPQSNDVTFGIRLFSHYVPERNALTPPQTMMMELDFTLWLSRWFGAYLILAKSYSGAPSSAVGPAIKISFGSFTNTSPSAIIRTVWLQAPIELVYHSTEPPVPPYAYTAAGVQIRGGLGGVITFGYSEPIFVDIKAIVTRYSSNWCIAPFLGIGLRL